MVMESMDRTSEDVGSSQVIDGDVSDIHMTDSTSIFFKEYHEQWPGSVLFPKPQNVGIGSSLGSRKSYQVRLPAFTVTRL